MARLSYFVCFLMLGCLSAHGEASLEWMTKAFDDGRHNAFTDLIRWNDAYYLCFRHGATHMSMDGEIRIMRSADLKTWEACATLDTFGDDRDPHFVSDDTALYCYFGTWNLEHKMDHGLPDRGCVRSYFAKTADGVNWSKIQGVYESGWWLWRVRWHGGFFYSAAYTASRPSPDARETRLLRSKDGLEWEMVSCATKAHKAGEADIHFPPEGGVWLFSRTGNGAGTSFWLRSNPEMTEWRETDSGVLVHAPVFGLWKDWFVVGGRAKTDEGYRTRFWRIEGDTLSELITLPSGGDTSYPGLIVVPPEDGGQVPSFLVSWYSQHENDPGDKHAASVYVGCIRPNAR